MKELERERSYFLFEWVFNVNKMRQKNNSSEIHETNEIYEIYWWWFFIYLNYPENLVQY